MNHSRGGSQNNENFLDVAFHFLTDEILSTFILHQRLYFILHRGAQLWNNLPIDLRQASSLADFKSKLSRHSLK